MTHPRHPRRPPWWPENEPFPPRGHRPGWRMGRRFMWIFAAWVMFIVALAVTAGSLTAWLWHNVLGGVPGAPGPLRGLAVLGVLLLAAGLGVAARAGTRVALPVSILVDAAGRVEAGDYSVRIPEPRQPQLRRIVRSFNAMSARLAETDTARRAFLADVAHELRTPLAVIRGQAEGIADGMYPADPEHVAPILEATRSLEQLVDDLRTLTLAEAGALDLRREPVDVGVLAAELADGFRPQADAAGVRVVVSIPELPVVEADPVRLRSVLGNLLTNALAHTPRGGTVTVSGRRLAAGVEIGVADSGPGFPPEVLPHVFDRFVKGGPGAGSGLGLAIARDLVQAHGGRIEAANRAAGGAEVRFTLPVETGEGRPAGRPSDDG